MSTLKDTDLSNVSWFGLVKHGVRAGVELIVQVVDKAGNSLDSVDGYIATVDKTGKTLEKMATNNFKEVTLKGEIDARVAFAELEEKYPKHDLQAMAEELGINVTSAKEFT